MNVKFLIPLGLLGLLGIVALILIYIIKPNFQQKLLSSTFLWRLSLKFKKKKIPLSRLRNILLIACQVLIITAIAAILAKTIHVLKEKATQPEVVLVIDSSASMRAGTEESTRYERAVEAAVRQAGGRRTATATPQRAEEGRERDREEPSMQTGVTEENSEVKVSLI